MSTKNKLRYGLSLMERTHIFQNLMKNPKLNSESKWPVPINGSFKQLPIFTVRVELPKYRLDNTRTLYLQEQYIFNNKLDDDFFMDVESDKVQEVQHEILKSLIENSDNDKDLKTYFSKTEQTDPLILTHDGFVISGNRRLCTFRELLEEDYEKHKRYAEIQVVILPYMDEERVDEIEDFLEQQRDIKEPFSWVSRAIGYRRRMRKYDVSDGDLSKVSGIKKNEITSLINKLEIADRYLESINSPKAYNQVLDDFYAFEKIYSCEQKDKGNVIKQNAFEKISFLAIKNKNTFSDRMYKNIPLIYETQALIHNQIAEDFEDEIKTINEKEGDDLLDGLFPNQDIAIIKVLENPKNEERVIEIVSDKIEEYLTLEKEKKKKIGVLDRVRKANKLLIESNMVKSHESSKSGIIAQLDNLEEEIKKLRNWANS